MHQIHCKKAFMKHPKASTSFREEGNVLLWLFLLCCVTKASLSTCEHNHVIIWSNSSARRRHVFTCSFKQFSTWLVYFEWKKIILIVAAYLYGSEWAANISEVSLTCLLLANRHIKHFITYDHKMMVVVLGIQNSFLSDLNTNQETD